MKQFLMVLVFIALMKYRADCLKCEICVNPLGQYVSCQENVPNVVDSIQCSQTDTSCCTVSGTNNNAQTVSFEFCSDGSLADGSITLDPQNPNSNLPVSKDFYNGLTTATVKNCNTDMCNSQSHKKK